MAKIDLDTNGLAIQYTLDKETFLSWDEIYRIHVSKIEIPFASPITYLTFDTDYGEFIEVNDSDEGWQNVLTSLANHIAKGQNDLPTVVEKISPQDGAVEIYARTN